MSISKVTQKLLYMFKLFSLSSDAGPEKFAPSVRIYLPQMAPGWWHWAQQFTSYCVNGKTQL